MKMMKKRAKSANIRRPVPHYMENRKTCNHRRDSDKLFFKKTKKK